MVKHFVFVASAGAYKADSIEPMHVEGDERKSSAGHVAVEDYLKEVRARACVCVCVMGAVAAGDDVGDGLWGGRAARPSLMARTRLWPFAQPTLSAP